MPTGKARSVLAKRSAPLIGMAGVLAFALPSTGLAVVSLTGGVEGLEGAAMDVFTPASVDPELAAKVANITSNGGFRFTPAGSRTLERERTITVAVRVDEKTAKAISVRSAINTRPGLGSGIAGLQASRYNLGTARDYESFARPLEFSTPVRDLKVPDISEFKPSGPAAKEKPGRLQPRLTLEGQTTVGRSPNTLDALESQTVDLGGSFRLSPNLDVTAGVRLSQDRGRLDPLTNSVQDNQAVYVGTKIKF